jgi:dTMP kinase
MLIIFEGLDGAGKTTHINKLLKKFQNNHKVIRVCKSRGESNVAKQIEQILYNTQPPPLKNCKLYLYYATLWDNMYNFILKYPNDIVILDRFISSTYAYQGAEGLDKSLIKLLNKQFIDEIGEDKIYTIYLNITPEKSLEMKSDTFSNFKQVLNDSEKLELLHKVNDNYCEDFPKKNSYLIEVGDKSEDEVYDEVEKIFLEIIM